MRFSLLALCLCLGISTMGVRSARADLDEDDRKQYRMGDDADEKKRTEAAKKVKPAFDSPEALFRTWQAAMILGDKTGYLACLEPEYRQKKYPDGDKERIKRVQSTKYRYLAMYARIAKVEASGDDGTMAVEFTYKADGGAGREKKDTDGFKLHRVAGRWLFASQ